MAESNLVCSLYHTIGSHTSDVNGVCFSKNTLATCSADKTVRLWGLEDFGELSCSPLCGHTYYVHCCTFSSFGTTLATCSTDGKVILWDVKTGEKKGVLQHPSKTSIRVCAFSADFSLLVSGSDDETLCVWEVSTRRLLRSLQGHEASVVAGCFTPDSSCIVSGSTKGDLRVWDAKYGHGKNLAVVLNAHDLGVTCCVFSPIFGTAEDKGSMAGHGLVHHLLASTGQDNLVKLWDFVSEVGGATVQVELRAELCGHTGPVMACSFSPNGKLLASGSIDKTLRLWNPASGQCLTVIEAHTRLCVCCAFSHDSKMLASGSNDRSVMLWKITTADEIIDHLIDASAEVNDTVLTRVKPLDTWSVDDVCQWLEELGLDQYTPNFRDNEIDGTELLTLKQETLEHSIGVGEYYKHFSTVIKH
ncbi:hypothetical protein ScPMuIL_003976 [Solemya velum]